MSLLSIQQLNVSVPQPSKKRLQILHNISTDIGPGQSLGVVGESGSGKTTLARTVVGLQTAQSGHIHWQQQPIGSLALRQRQQAIQFIFQNPRSSFNPRWRMHKALHEPMQLLRPEWTARQRQQRIDELLPKVQLSTGLLQRQPHELSGGQCQRLAIMRALLVAPQLLICDEPVSALDVTVQAQILALLKQLQVELGLSLMFIAHDLAVVEQLCDRVMVLRQGQVVEQGLVQDVFGQPQQCYTQALLAAVPTLTTKTQGVVQTVATS